MQADEQGFLYPKIDVQKCIGCSLCDKACPVINKSEAKEPKKVYAAKNRDEKIRYESSSGGLFTALAVSVLSDGGVVFGVAFDSDWSAKHTFVESVEELHKFRGSKYLQSRMESSYSDVKRFLKEGRKVLFSGTSCQTAGLSKFLGKDYENLLSVDLICHGVPSPMIWQEYLDTLENRKDIQSIKFRDKQIGWERAMFVVEGADWSLSEPMAEAGYLRGFLKDVYNRPSCFACPAKDGRSASDITIADYWGIKRVLPKFHDNLGVGLAMTWSEKGELAYTDCGFESIETSLKAATKRNTCFYKSTPRSNYREGFWERYFRDGYGAAIEATLSLIAAEQPKKRKGLLSRLWKSLKKRLKGEKYI